MTLEVHVNGVSITTVQDQRESDQLVLAFTGVLREVRRRRGDATLVSSIRLQDVVLYGHHTLGEWGKRDANRDLWRMVLRMQDKSSGWCAVVSPDGSEYKIGDLTVPGMGGAHMSDGLLLSFATGENWKRDSVDGKRYFLEETEGSLELRAQDVVVRHASDASHLRTHLDWMTQAGLEQFESGADLLANHKDVFTQVTLLDAARDQLRKLDAKWVAPVARELALMNRALLEWKDEAPFPAWYTKVTPESQSRLDKGLAEFVDADGVRRDFSTHARLTPDEGRIHFRVIKASQSALVAYIGPKIL